MSGRNALLEKDELMRLLRIVTLITFCLCALAAIAISQESTPPATDNTGGSATTVDSIHKEDVAQATAEETAAEPTPGVLDFLLTKKYLIWLVLAAAGLVLLLGRWVNWWVRLTGLIVIFVVLGLNYFVPIHPSPMCGVTKLFMFKFTEGIFFPAFLVIFLAMMIPSLIGRKLFCGWVCPLGALQELVNKIPSKLRWKQFNFTAFNSVRMGLLVMFFLTFFLVRDQIGMLADQVGANPNEQIWRAFAAYSVYEPINFFELLHWNWAAMDTLWFIMFTVLVLSSYVLYRPFCYLVCPIGAITWLLERIAPGRIRIDHARCNDCGICVIKSPCPTIAKLIDKDTKVAPDCTSCGECLNTCPSNAIKFSFTK